MPTNIVIKLGDWDYTKYKEMWDWCNHCTKAAWEAPHFNPWQYEALLSNNPTISANFVFHNDADAAMFKLTWFETDGSIF